MDTTPSFSLKGYLNYFILFFAIATKSHFLVIFCYVNCIVSFFFHAYFPLCFPPPLPHSVLHQKKKIFKKKKKKKMNYNSHLSLGRVIVDSGEEFAFKKSGSTNPLS